VSELAANESQRYAASAADVWAYRLDFSNLPAYNPAVSEIARVSDGEGPGGGAGQGAVYHLTLQTPEGSHPVTMTVTGVEADAVVEADMAGAMTAHERFVVSPEADGYGCVAVLQLWLDLPEGVNAQMRAALLEGGRQQIRLELDGMKVQIDG
jgi:hypothetical protein